MEEIKQEENKTEHNQGGYENNEIRELLNKNLELTKEILEMTKKIKKFITFQKVMSIIYILIIVVPIILSIFYLPPLLKDVIGPYKELLGLTEAAIQVDPSSINLDSLPENIREHLK
ncbi:hypothetical protein ACFLZ9_00080 [Patescibacteria group bacterium]